MKLTKEILALEVAMIIRDVCPGLDHHLEIEPEEAQGALIGLYSGDHIVYVGESDEGYRVEFHIADPDVSIDDQEPSIWECESAFTVFGIIGSVVDQMDTLG